MRHLASFFLILLTAVADARAQAPAPPAVRHRRPIVFEQNVGQFPPTTLFAAHTPEASLSIGHEGDVTVNGLPVRLSHARRVTARGEQPATVRYLGANPREVPSYARIVLPEVLHDIDWVWRSSDESIAFEFVIHPGGNPRAIALQFDHASRLRVENGNLVVTARGKRTVHPRPHAYQEIAGARQTISAAWRVSGRRAKFAVGAYDRHTTLVIEPASSGTPPAPPGSQKPVRGH